MSHLELMTAQPVGFPLEDQRHLSFTLDMLSHLQNIHAPRIRQTQLDRKLVSGDLWGKQAGTRKVTSSIPHNIVSAATALLLPKDPEIAIIPMSQDTEAGRKADALLRWLYALLQRSGAQQQFQHQSSEVIVAGVGCLHVQPYALALKGREVPILLNVPDSDAVLYDIGPMELPTTVFIKHKFTTAQIRQRFNVSMKQYSQSDNTEHECWCYYCEERYIDPEDGEVKQMVLYGLLCESKWIVPLTDITVLFPGIPVSIAFNSEGYNWAGRSEMRARGNLSHIEEQLILASDFLTQLAYNQFRGLNPALLVSSTTGQDPPTLDITPGRQNNFVNGEAVRALVESQPTPQSFQFERLMVQQIADASIPQIFSPMQQIEGVSGSAQTEQMHPFNVKNNVKQDLLARSIAVTCELMLRYMAVRVDPHTGMTLFGADPRDRSQIVELLYPEDLLEAVYIDVRLPSQTPRNVYLMVQLLMNLTKEGIISQELSAETIVRLLDLPVSDMSSMMQAAQADQIRKVQMQIAQQEAMKLLPQVREAANNRGLNPDAMSDGSKPIQLNSQGADPMMVNEGSMQPQPQAPGQAPGMGY